MTGKTVSGRNADRPLATSSAANSRSSLAPVLRGLVGSPNRRGLQSFQIATRPVAALTNRL